MHVLHAKLPGILACHLAGFSFNDTVVSIQIRDFNWFLLNFGGKHLRIYRTFYI